MKLFVFLLLAIAPSAWGLVTDKIIRTSFGSEECGASPANCTALDHTRISDALAVTYVSRRRKLRGERRLVNCALCRHMCEGFYQCEIAYPQCKNWREKCGNRRTEEITETANGQDRALQSVHDEMCAAEMKDVNLIYDVLATDGSLTDDCACRLRSIRHSDCFTDSCPTGWELDENGVCVESASCDFQCPSALHFVRKPGLQCYSDMSDCECTAGRELQHSQGVDYCIQKWCKIYHPSNWNYACPANSHRIDGQDCYDSFTNDCACDPGYKKNLWQQTCYKY